MTPRSHRAAPAAVNAAMPKYTEAFQWNAPDGWRDTLVSAAIDELERRGASLADLADDKAIVAAGKRVLPDVAAGIFGFRLPPQWKWGRINWIEVVRQAATLEAHGLRRAKRRMGDRGAEGNRLDDLAHAAVDRDVAPARFNDTRTLDHRGFTVFPNVFKAEEVAALRAEGDRITEWEKLFNSVTFEPQGKRFDDARTDLRGTSWNELLKMAFEPTHRTSKDWTHDTQTSNFRLQGKFKTNGNVVRLVKSKLKTILPEDAVFPPSNDFLYMIKNNLNNLTSSDTTGEQPMHYDFKEGVSRLSVIISLDDDVYVAFGDRWSRDHTEIKWRVRVPSGGVVVFSNGVPHAGMGDVAREGVLRAHLYVGLGQCEPSDVHPRCAEHGYTETYYAMYRRVQRPLRVPRKRPRDQTSRR